MSARRRVAADLHEQLPKQPPTALVVHLVCCGKVLETMRVSLDPAGGGGFDDPALLLNAESVQDDLAYEPKLRLVCPSCGSDTRIGRDHPVIGRALKMRDAYAGGAVDAAVWDVDVRSWQWTLSARLRR